MLAQRAVRLLPRRSAEVKEMSMRPLSFCYSLDYSDFLDTVKGEFEAWLRHELTHGGALELRIDHKISELTAHYLPSSPRQLMELAMQCEALLDVSIEDPIFGHQAEDAYEALRIAITRWLIDELWMVREALRHEDGAEPGDQAFPFPPPGGDHPPHDGYSDEGNGA